MKLWLRIALLLGAFLVLTVAAALVLLPRLAGSDAVRAELIAAGREATGREVRFGELGVALMPPSLRLSDAFVAGPQPEDPAFLEGASIDLRISWLSLLSLSPVVDSLVIEGATLRLVRGEDGLLLPGPEASGESTAASAGPEAGTEGAEASDEGGDPSSEPLNLAIRRVLLTGAQVFFEDRTVKPILSTGLVDIEAEATGALLEKRLDFDLSGRFATGGTLELTGHAQAEGVVEIRSELGDVPISAFAAYAPEGVGRWDGILSGVITARRPDSGDDELDVELRLADGNLQIDDIFMTGALQATANLKGAGETAHGDFDIDATQAELRYSEFFTKPPGTPARATGRLRSQDGAVQVEETRIKVASAEAETSAVFGDIPVVRVDAAPFPVAPLLALFPEYAEHEVGGEVSFDGLKVTLAKKLLLDGAAGFHELRFTVPDGPPVTVDGVWRGQGNGVVGDPLAVEVAGQRLPLRVSIENLDASPRVSIAGAAEDLDSKALMAAFGQGTDTLEGPLDLDLDLNSSLDENAVSALKGKLGFEIRPGRLKGVSLLESTMGQLGGLGQAALAVGEDKGGRSLKRLYGDDFEVLSGNFQLADGVARTRDLHLVYREYEVSLLGSLGLSDLGLDMKGTLTLSEKAEDSLSDPSAASKPKRVIPIAHLGGTVSEPKVRIDPKDALSIARAARPEKVEELSEKIDEKLGEGSGKQILDALEGFLGGGRR